MAQEGIIRRKAIEILTLEGWVVWCGAKAMYRSSDIFGIFDGIAVKKGEVNKLRFIQWTSKSNMAARRRKMYSFFKVNHLFITCELWGYEDGKFTVELIEG